MAGNDNKVVGPSAPTLGPLIPPTDFGAVATKIKDIVLPPTTSVGQQGAAYQAMLDGINAKLGIKNLDAQVPPTDPLLQSSKYNVAELTAIGKALRKAGYSVKSSTQDILYLLQTNPVLLGMQQKSPTYATFIDRLNKDYIPGLDSSAGNTPALPSKTVSQYDPLVLSNFVDTIYQNTLGRKATAEESAGSLKQLQTMINKGTVSTTKKVGGQNVTTVTPGFSQERAQATIEEQLKQLNPDDYDRTKRIDFSTWLSQNIGGQ